MNKPIVDKLGQVIVPGCYIAYGHALGRCAGIRVGKVLAAKRVKSEYTDESEYRITVQGVEDDWHSEKPTLCERKGTLRFPERTIVIHPAIVPPNFKELLDDVPV
jgi:hypothetical protein